MFIQFSILTASMATFIAIALLRPFALSINLVDIPSSRKLHSGSVPLIGGIAMFLGFVVSFLILPVDLNDFNYFILASLILVCIGVLDDHRDISVLVRLLFQALAAIIIVSGGGLSITSLGNILGTGEIFLNGWAYFITVIAIIAGINAVNMADGIHGLAGGNSLVTFLAILFLAIGNIPYQNLWILLLFCAVLPVFLMYNLCIGMSKSKRIFMGDAGSMFIGMGIVWLLLDFSQSNSRIFNPVTALWLFAVPIIDIVWAIMRRIASGKSPFKPDIYHIHHILMHLGVKQANVLLIVLFLSLLMALIGILGERYEIAEWMMFSGFLIVFILYLFSYRVAIRKIENNSN
jgi:UDP-GlcNAc:undecaprenyl-phosphate GlcNAc-1-phosphate transferase